jgi:hypothetical protein
MAELDDALEAAILAEDRFFEQGHSEGVRIGEQQGFDEGVAFGCVASRRRGVCLRLALCPMRVLACVRCRGCAFELLVVWYHVCASTTVCAVECGTHCAPWGVLLSCVGCPRARAWVWK